MGVPEERVNAITFRDSHSQVFSKDVCGDNVSYYSLGLLILSSVDRWVLISERFGALPPLPTTS